MMRPIARRHRSASRATFPKSVALVAVVGLLLGAGGCSSTGETPQMWPHVFGLRDVCIPATTDPTR
jgi:hypothetical protein